MIIPSPTDPEAVNFDLCWKDASRDDVLVDFPLALEFEWSRDGCLYDFQKLLMARSKHRVMVFAANDEPDWRNRCKHLIGHMGGFALTNHGDRMLFAGWNVAERRFHFRVHVVH